MSSHVRIETNNLSAEVFSTLRENKEFKKYKEKDIEIALTNTLFSVLIYMKGKPIGMGRIVGDDRIAFFIKDVVVIKEYRNNGFGKIIMEYLLAYINEKGCDGAYIGLMSTPNRESFYEKYGFIKRPTEGLGNGMVKFLVTAK
jgi:GNAT superfamily N-acetyltransferase